MNFKIHMLPLNMFENISFTSLHIITIIAGPIFEALVVLNRNHFAKNQGINI